MSVWISLDPVTEGVDDDAYPERSATIDVATAYYLDPNVRLSFWTGNSADDLDATLMLTPEVARAVADKLIRAAERTESANA